MHIPHGHDSAEVNYTIASQYVTYLPTLLIIRIVVAEPYRVVITPQPFNFTILDRVRVD